MTSRLRRTFESGLLYHERKRWHSPKPMCVRQIQPEDLKVNCRLGERTNTRTDGWKWATRKSLVLTYFRFSGTFAINDVSSDASAGGLRGQSLAADIGKCLLVDESEDPSKSHAVFALAKLTGKYTRTVSALFARGFAARKRRTGRKWAEWNNPTFSKCWYSLFIDFSFFYQLEYISSVILTPLSLVVSSLVDMVNDKFLSYT